MRNDHPAAGDIGRDLRQPIGNVLVRETMEAVAAHALRIEALGQRVMIGERTVAAVERRIEAGDLRQFGTSFENGADRREIVRLMPAPAVYSERVAR